MIRKHWLLLSDRFNALKPRERAIIFGVSAAVLCGATYLLALEPALARKAQFQQQLRTNETTLAQLSQQELELVRQSLTDPDAARNQELAALTQTNQRTRGDLNTSQSRLAPPERMPQLLADLLARQPGLELVSARTLPPEDLLAKSRAEAAAEAVGSAAPAGAGSMALSPIALGPGAAPAGDANAAAAHGVYRHGLEITVKGNYLDLAAYARKVEQLPWRLYWGPMDLEVERYPTAKLRFVVYTLSLDPAWLSL